MRSLFDSLILGLLLFSSNQTCQALVSSRTKNNLNWNWNYCNNSRRIRLCKAPSSFSVLYAVSPQKKTTNKKRNNDYRNNSSSSSEIRKQKQKWLQSAKATNQELIGLTSASDVLALFVKKGGAKGYAGGGAFNSVNYSTCFHRLARFATFYNHNNKNNNKANNNKSNHDNLTLDQKRKIILSDPRFAILFASLAEALTTESNYIPQQQQLQEDDRLIFNSRELSNIAWAAAKLRMTPPSRILPVVRAYDDSFFTSSLDERNDGLVDKGFSNVDPEVLKQELIELASKVRTEVLEVAKERSQLVDAKERAAVPNKWIPTTSQLSAKLLDWIATMVLLQEHQQQQKKIKNNKQNPQELANLLWAFATAQRADPILFDILIQKLILPSQKNMLPQKPQELSNSIWAFASSGIRTKGQISLFKYTADSFRDAKHLGIDKFKPQELSNTAWGIATLLSKRGNSKKDGSSTSIKINEEDEAAVYLLRRIAQELSNRAEFFKTQEISNTIWAFATVGFGVADSTQFNAANDYMYLSMCTKEDVDLIKQTLDVVAQTILPKLNRFRPQELNNLAWGLARLGHYNEPSIQKVCQGIGLQILKRRHQFTPQDVGTTLWSFATLGYFDENVYHAAASRLTLRDAKSFKPQEMSNTVWALATANIVPKYLHAFDSTLVPASKRNTFEEITNDPITECFAAAANEIMRRPLEFKEQEMKDILWSLSRVGVRHPSLFRNVAIHLVGPDNNSNDYGRGLAGFSPQGLGNLAWSFAKQAQLADTVSEKIKTSNIGSNGRLAVYETSCLDFGEGILTRLFSRIAEAGLEYHDGLRKFKPQDLSNTVWAFAILGMLHREFFSITAEQVKERLSSFTSKSAKNTKNEGMLHFKSQELANLVWSFATVNYRTPGLLDSIAPYILSVCNRYDKKGYDVSSIANKFKRKELANIAWSCAVLEQYPTELIQLLYTGLIGNGDREACEQLKLLYGDDGLQKQAIMTLFYVQTAVERETQIDVGLPIGFPDGWGESDDSMKKSRRRSDDKGETSTSMLELSTSKLQHDVSQILNKIDFKHIEELVIGTDEILMGESNKGSSSPINFLSIDIARLDDKIGIEVDGPAHFVTILDADTYDGGTNIASERGNSNQPTKKNKPSTHGYAKKMGSKMGWQFLTNSSRQGNGPTALKHRLLCHLGWCVLHIPFFDWYDLNGDVDNQSLYCQELLEEIIE